MCSETRAKIKELRKQAKQIKKTNAVTLDEAQHFVAQTEGYPNWESLVLAIEG